MHIQKLIILGLLKSGAKHGYEIKKFIKNQLGVFSSLENKSIYYPLKIMEKEGFIGKKIISSKNCLPRHIYTITFLGEKEFSKCALQALLSEKRPFFDVDIPLYFLPYLEKKEVIARLKVRKKFLEKVKIWLNNRLDKEEDFPAHQKILLKHHLNLLTAEENFFDEFVEKIKNE